MGFLSALYGAALLATTASDDPLTLVVSQFAGYGVVGAVAIILGIVTYKGWCNDQKRWRETILREQGRTKSAEERAERAEQLNADLNREVRERVVPALTEVTRATAELVAMRDRDHR